MNLELNHEEQSLLLLGMIKYSVAIQMDINEKIKLNIPIERDTIRLNAVDTLIKRIGGA